MLDLFKRLSAPDPAIASALCVPLGIALNIVGLSFGAAVGYAVSPPQMEQTRLLPAPLPPPAAKPDEPDEPAVVVAKAYLIQTAKPGGTMAFIGREKAIGWLHPEFALRAARAVKRAQAEGIPAHCSSAYRPFGLGVGGFANKRNSRHTFGTACDFSGIGRPASGQAKRFYQIASEEGLCNPYGPAHKAEWSHFQLGCEKVVPLRHPLQSTVDGKGPIDVEKMWELTASLVGAIEDTAEFGSSTAKSVVAINISPSKKTRIVKAKKKVRTKIAKQRWARRS